MGRHAGKVPVALACLLTAGGRSGFRRTSHYCNWTDGNNNNEKGGEGAAVRNLATSRPLRAPHLIPFTS